MRVRKIEKKANSSKTRIFAREMNKNGNNMQIKKNWNYQLKWRGKTLFKPNLSRLSEPMTRRLIRVTEK